MYKLLVPKMLAKITYHEKMCSGASRPSVQTTLNLTSEHSWCSRALVIYVGVYGLFLWDEECGCIA